MIFHIILLSFGLGSLIFGSNLLLNTSLNFARHFRLSPFVIGSLLLGMGTSTPELFVSGLSAVSGYPNQALGNVIGSNIFNLMIVMGLVLYKFPALKSLPKEMKRDFRFLCLGSVLLFFFLLNGILSRPEAGILMAYFSIFLILCMKSTKHPEGPSEGSLPEERNNNPSDNLKNENDIISPPPPSKNRTYPFFRNTLLIVLGFIAILGGGHLTILSSQNLGYHLGLSERLIGTFILSVGTGLPELSIAFVALFKARQYNALALSNIIGSNIFNTGLVLGVSALILPINSDPDIIALDIPVLLASHLPLIALIFFCSLKWLPKILSCLVIPAYMLYVIFALY